MRTLFPQIFKLPWFYFLQVKFPFPLLFFSLCFFTITIFAQISPDEIKKLKEAGVSDEVIKTLIESQSTKQYIEESNEVKELFNLVDEYEKLGDFDKAIFSCNNITNKYPHSDISAKAILKKGELMIKQLCDDYSMNVYSDWKWKYKYKVDDKDFYCSNYYRVSVFFGMNHHFYSLNLCFTNCFENVLIDDKLNEITDIYQTIIKDHQQSKYVPDAIFNLGLVNYKSISQLPNTNVAKFLISDIGSNESLEKSKDYFEDKLKLSKHYDKLIVRHPVGKYVADKKEINELIDDMDIYTWSKVELTQEGVRHLFKQEYYKRLLVAKNYFQRLKKDYPGNILTIDADKILNEIYDIEKWYE